MKYDSVHMVGVQTSARAQRKQTSLMALVAGQVRFRTANHQPERQGSWPRELSPVSWAGGRKPVLLRAQTILAIEGLFFGAAAKLISSPQPCAFSLVSVYSLTLPFSRGLPPPPGAVD